MPTILRIALVTCAALFVACTSPADPCTEGCDGIARCMAGNATCVANGVDGSGSFMQTCTSLCEAAGAGLDAEQEAQVLECLDCLRGQSFSACNGEILLDETCMTTCRSDGAGAFRNQFGPAIFDATPGIECLRE